MTAGNGFSYTLHCTFSEKCPLLVQSRRHKTLLFPQRRGHHGSRHWATTQVDDDIRQLNWRTIHGKATQLENRTRVCTGQKVVVSQQKRHDVVNSLGTPSRFCPPRISTTNVLNSSILNHHQLKFDYFSRKVQLIERLASFQ